MAIELTLDDIPYWDIPNDNLFGDVVLLSPFDRDTTDITEKTQSISIGSGAYLSGNKSKWGKKSLYVDGTNNGYFTYNREDIGVIKNKNYFCIDFWFFIEDVLSQTEYIPLVSIGGSDLFNRVLIGITPVIHNNPNFAGSKLATSVSSPSGLHSILSTKVNNLTSQWHHARYIEQDDFCYTIIDGVKSSINKARHVKNTIKNDETLDVRIGKCGIRFVSGTPLFKGYISDLRITSSDNNSRSFDLLPPTTAYQIFNSQPNNPANIVGGENIEFISDTDITLNLYAALKKAHQALEVEIVITPSTKKPESQSEISVIPALSAKKPEAVSQISILPALESRHRRTEIIYLAPENQSKFSTGFINKLLAGEGIKSIFDGGMIEIYTGNRPYSANHATTGTLLGVIKNIVFSELVENRTIKKEKTQWQFNAINDGTVGWLRIKTSNDTDYGQDSLREVRIDGEANTDFDALNFEVKSGELYFIDELSITWGNG